VEQLANDSIWVLIDNDRKFISVFAMQGGYTNYLKAQLGQATPNDSIINQWIREYVVTSSNYSNDQSIMELVPKQVPTLNSAGFSGKIFYNSLNNLPSRILLNKVQIEPISFSDSTLLRDEGGVFFTDTSNPQFPVIATKLEYRTEIEFLKIERESTPVPKKIEDFVVYESGRYKPTATYKGYEVIQY
jgi:hypothetical protein